VSIHGSVHLLGNNLPDGAGALEAIDLSGTSLIHNNYDGLSVNLANRVPPLGTRSFDGEMVETLEPTFPIWMPVITTGTLLSIVETHTDEFKTDFAVMTAP